MNAQRTHHSIEEIERLNKGRSVAMEFTEWVGENYYKLLRIGPGNRYWKRLFDTESITTDQLFTRFIEDKSAKK